MGEGGGFLTGHREKNLLKANSRARQIYQKGFQEFLREVLTGQGQCPQPPPQERVRKLSQKNTNGYAREGFFPERGWRQVSTMKKRES